MTFDRKTVMITGAAGNLGRAVAQAFADRGARHVLVDLDRERLEAVYGAEGEAGRVFAPINLLDCDQVDAGVRAVVDRCGRIDVLCHLAGGFRMGEAVHETSAATWDFLFDLNARTLVNVAHAAVPQMLEAGGGRIVAVGATAAQKGMAQMGAYCASKASLIRLVEAMSAELREKGVNVNCVLPSIIDTPENRRAMPDADPGRWVTPAQLADAIVFLASDSAAAIHGAALPVTGLS